MQTPLIRNLDLLRIAGFFIVLALPIADYFLNTGVTAGVSENRILAAAPDWSWDAEFLEGAPTQYEAYVNDHIGYRYRRKARTEAPVQFHHLAANLSLDLSSGTDHAPQRFTTNSLGFRGPEFTADSKYRILCVGGSTTQNHQLDDADAWPRRLMSELNNALGDGSVWVGAAGVPGFATPQHLQFVQTSPTMHDYTDVVFLTGINDMLYWLGYKASREETSESARSTEQAEEDEQPFNPLESNLDEWADFLETARSKRAFANIVTPYPKPDRILKTFRTQINEIIDRCNELGVRPVFLTHPVLWAKDLPPAAESQLWMGKMRKDGDYLSPAGLRELMDRFNAVLTETCTARGVLVIDLSFMSGTANYFEDDCHFTPEGAAVLAHQVAKDILARIGNG